MLSVPVDVYGARFGCFGTIAWRKDKIHYVSWNNCREVFHLEKPKKHFLFCCNNPADVIRFMRTIQTRLRLSRSKRLKIKKTNNEFCILVETSKFWRKPVPYNLLTLFLRAGQSYTKGRTYKTAMRQFTYLDETMPAVERFLKGYCHTRRGSLIGWHNVFRNKTEKQVKKILIRRSK